VSEIQEEYSIKLSNNQFLLHKELDQNWTMEFQLTPAAIKRGVFSVYRVTSMLKIDF